MSDNNKVAIKLIDVGFSYWKRAGFSFKKHPVLKNINIDIYQGETIGIIGQNGCGKSTILKLLAGIFKPDSGEINLYNNHISMQSLSAGFDVELTGADNALLGAMLLGHAKKTAMKKLTKIQELAELNELFYEPVKTYSAGMRARLGFATAITMKTDVLLIDEVLAVGDAIFRKKAEKIIKQKTQSHNMTVVIVSHEKEQIENLCDRVIYLHEGQIASMGDSEVVFQLYNKAL